MPSRSHPPSFRALFDAQVGFVWRTLRRLGVPDRELEDACLEVFQTAHRKWGELEGRARIQTHLTGIARQVARATRQQTQRRRGLLGAESYTHLVHEVVGMREHGSVPPGAAWVESVNTGKQVPLPLGTLGASEIGPEPSLATRARMLAQLEDALGVAGTVPPANAKLFGLTLALGASVLLGGAGLLLQRTVGDLPEAGAAASEDPGPRGAAVTSALLPAGPPNAPGLLQPKRERAPGVREVAETDLSGERWRLDEAQRALAARPAHALQLALDHARLYPHSRLAESRALITIEALRLLDRTAEASQHARSFEQSFPDPQARTRLQRALGVR